MQFPGNALIQWGANCSGKVTMRAFSNLHAALVVNRGCRSPLQP